MNNVSASPTSSSGRARPTNTGQTMSTPDIRAKDDTERRSLEGRRGELSERRQDAPATQLAAGQWGALSDSATPVLPPVDIFEDDAGVTILADLPGVPKDRLGVRVEGDSLVIEGTAVPPQMGDMELLYGEVLSPFYRRSFTLSRDLDPGKIEANLHDGVLKLNIAKTEQAKPRRIEVRVS
ncbi:MAG: Hsp20/alpha crystallin family protein [Rhodoferax sp.]|nr:Hsp20/alpha crystallin family protein [Rhodoferax sp.]